MYIYRYILGMCVYIYRYMYMYINLSRYIPMTSPIYPIVAPKIFDALNEPHHCHPPNAIEM